MSFLSYKHVYSPKIELKSKECFYLVLQPLKDHVTIKVNGSLTSEDIFRTVVSMAVDKNSVHSVSQQYLDVACETSLRYHLKKLNMEELIKSNEKILLQEIIKTLKTRLFIIFWSCIDCSQLLVKLMVNFGNPRRY